MKDIYSYSISDLDKICHIVANSDLYEDDKSDIIDLISLIQNKIEEKKND